MWLATWNVVAARGAVDQPGQAGSPTRSSEADGYSRNRCAQDVFGGPHLGVPGGGYSLLKSLSWSCPNVRCGGMGSSNRLPTIVVSARHPAVRDRHATTSSIQEVRHAKSGPADICSKVSRLGCSRV
jgi:hypothetical protein